MESNSNEAEFDITNQYTHSFVSTKNIFIGTQRRLKVHAIRIFSLIQIMEIFKYWFRFSTGSGNGLLPYRRQAMTWTSAD